MIMTGACQILLIRVELEVYAVVIDLFSTAGLNSSELRW